MLGFSGPEGAKVMFESLKLPVILSWIFETCEEVVDGNGIKIVHSSALSDLEMVEQASNGI